MAEPLKKDEALAAAVREAFQRHMENARQAAQALKDKQAATASTSTAITRDARLAVPKPANESGAAPIAPPAPVVATSAPASPDTPSLSRLVAIASPQKVVETPAELDTPAEPETLVAETAKVAPPAVPAVETQAAPEPKPSVVSSPEPADNGFDFGEALFIEIAPESDKQSPAEAPKMPKAASLDTPLPEVASPPETASPRTEADLEFRHPPSRERPRMSTASPTAAAPQDLDQLAKPAVVHKPSPLDAKPSAKEEKATVAPVHPNAARPAPHFGVNTPAKPAAANAKGAPHFGRARNKIKLPAPLIASVVLGAMIMAVGAYFWTNPSTLQSLGAMVAPPSPPQTNVAAAPARPAPQTDVAAAPPSAAPQTQVAAAPTPSPSTIDSISVSTPAAPATTRSVSTIAINLDEVDQAVQTARELTANGDIDGAREALESYKTGSNPRALFALAETYDPAIVKDPAKADPAQAKAFYEAAARAGSQDTADRIARLALAHAN